MPNSFIDRAYSHMDESWKVTNKDFIDGIATVDGKKVKGIVYDLDDDLELRVKTTLDFTAKWIEETPGIMQRYFLPSNLNIYDVNAESVKALIGGDYDYKKSIQGVINGGVTGPGNFMTFPSHAAMIQKNADLHNVNWSFDVATPKEGHSTANDIAKGLNNHTPGVYIAIFSKTRKDIEKPVFNTKLFGEAMSIEVYVDGKPNTGNYNASYGLEDSGFLENAQWSDAKGFIEQDYRKVASMITDNLQESNLKPEDVKGIFVINQTQKNMPFVKTNSSIIAEKNGLSGLKYVFDIASACATTQVAFAVADGLMSQAPNGERIIASIGESLDRITDMYHPDKSKRGMDANDVLFGYANGIFGLAKSYGNKGFVRFDGGNNPFDGKDLWIHKDIDGYLRMPKGAIVMKNAINEVSNMIIDNCRYLDWQNDGTMIHFTHNANVRIYEGIGRMLAQAGVAGILPKNIDKIANASCGSCARMLAIEFSECAEKKLNFDLTAYAAGIQTAYCAYHG